MSPAQLAERVIAWGGLTKVTPSDAVLIQVCEATLSHVQGLPVVADLPDPGASWPGSVVLGTVMLAARLYRRRNSPNGVETITADGVAYVARYDSDVARMLRTDAPQVG